MKRLLLFATVLLFAAALADARTWTAADGRKIEAEFVSATTTTVTIKRADGQSFTIELATLSPADQTFAQAEAKKKPAAAVGLAVFAGPYAQDVTGQWQQFEGKGNLQCMFFAAKTLDAAKKHPLVIYLHGKGNDVLSKRDLGFAAACAEPKNYKERPCLILAPQCPNENGWEGATGANLLKTLQDMRKTLPIDADRIYLVGYSMGGFGTFALLNQEPKLFAAGIPVAGGIGAGAARNLRRIPLWVFHGEKDDVVPPDGSRAIVKALERLKAPVKYTEFPGEGHGIPGKVQSDPLVHEWLFQQTRAK